MSGLGADGQPWSLRVVSAHLDNVAGPRRLWLVGSGYARRRQARALVSYLADTTPTVLGGDLNTWWGFDDRAYKETARAFHAGLPDDRRPTFRGLLRLDHVFFRLPAGWRGHAERGPSRFGSDHYPLIARIDLAADAPALRVSLTPGTRIGPYAILSQLGAGGMGEVYRAQDRGWPGRRAQGDSPLAGAATRCALDRLLREATLASALNHPNIVTIYETGVVDGDRYIAMELVEGSTLRRWPQGGLPVARALGIARQIAEALAVAHAAQIVHRDIKPDNVMVRPDGYVKLLDFGLARLQPDAIAAGHTTAATEAGLILGTIGYMAPEQARGETVSAEADIFALGVLLYELVTGRHPFMAASQLGTLHALMWETPEPPSLLNPELPRRDRSADPRGAAEGSAAAARARARSCTG